MKTCFYLVIAGLLLLCANPIYANDLEDVTNDFLAKQVKEGNVNYKGIVANTIELEQLVQLYSIQSLKQYSNEEVKAFYINAYNLTVIYQLISNYPVASPQEVPGFFDSKKFLIAGENLTLNQIEKQKLNPRNDPRLHFVLVCGAKSCPVIEPFAYRAEKLDAQLNQQTRKAVNDPSFIKLYADERRVEFSKIFSWYKEDFKKQSESGLQFINQYREQKIPLDYKQGYYDYDWSLNAQQVPSSILKDDEKMTLSNLQLYTPSALFKLGQYELNVFNSMYIQSTVRDKEGKEVDLNESQSFFNSLIQFTTGIPKTSRINVGIDFNITTARYGKSGESVDDFFNNSTTTYRKTVLSSIGPRIKVVPIESIPRLSIQSTFLFPVANNLETPKFIFHDRYTWFTQLFF